MENIFQPIHRLFEPAPRGGGARMAARSHALFRPSGAGTILVPLGLSESAHSSLAIARNLALESGATLVLLHAVWLNIAGEERGIHSFRLVLELCREAEAQLDELAGQLGGGVETKVIVHQGLSADVILETARHLRADAIIMQTHARRGWRKWFHRNTASRVIQKSSCPVWLVGQSAVAGKIDLVVIDNAALERAASRPGLNENSAAFRPWSRILSS